MNWNDIYNKLDNNDRVLDIIFREFDNMFHNGQFQLADKLIEEVDVNKLDILTIIGYLTATLSTKDRLPARALFVEKAIERLKILAPDRVDRLLWGLI